MMFDLLFSTFLKTYGIKTKKHWKLWSQVVDQGIRVLDKYDRGAKIARY